MKSWIETYLLLRNNSPCRFWTRHHLRPPNRSPQNSKALQMVKHTSGCTSLDPFRKYTNTRKSLEEGSPRTLSTNCEKDTAHVFTFPGYETTFSRDRADVQTCRRCTRTTQICVVVWWPRMTATCNSRRFNFLKQGPWGSEVDLWNDATGPISQPPWNSLCIKRRKSFEKDLAKQIPDQKQKLECC